MMKKIGIIGGGISGLAAAFLLKSKGFEVTLFEKSQRVGGNVQTVKLDGYLIEYAPNSLIKSPRLVDLIRALKLETEITTANPNNKKRYVLQNGELKSLPMSIAKMTFDGYFSMRAKLRLLKEPFIKTKSGENESVADFFERRLGGEILAKAADPFIAGIFAGNPENLSVKSAFPRLYELEKKYGSLLIGSLRSKSEPADANFPHSFSFTNGVQTLTDKLAESLGENIQTNTKVSKIEKTSNGKWTVSTERRLERRHPDGNERESANQNVELNSSPILTGDAAKITAFQQFDALIISTPAKAAANLIENIDPHLSEQLKSVYYPPVAMVFLGVKKANIRFNLDGFGFLIPSSERRKILGTLWNSAVFANRAPDGYHLLTTFVGGSRNAEMFEKSDDEIIETVSDELKNILGLTEKPDFTHVKRWKQAIPQYNLGYDKVETAIANFEAVNKGIYFCSNFYKGISVGDCVKNAYQINDEVENFLSRAD